ncbi:hypothetical protein B0H17DRAFT_1134128 [Mycena rosella]|uniref:Uncharacterized protein n=1 Tax=Mycena rosella TaxID=1033263 RepID=A0AAD7DGR6_MYCRO|nr:hypothetical protein B0H17DRAFT_1134128 [Mycena rosella]
MARAMGISLNFRAMAPFSPHNVGAQFGILYPGMPRTNLNHWNAAWTRELAPAPNRLRFDASRTPRLNFKIPVLHQVPPLNRPAASANHPCAILSAGAYSRHTPSRLAGTDSPTHALGSTGISPALVDSLEGSSSSFGALSVRKKELKVARSLNKTEQQCTAGGWDCSAAG